MSIGQCDYFLPRCLCARSLGSTQLLYQRNGSGKDLGKDVCLSHLHLEPENNAIPGRLPPLQSWQDQRSNPIQLRRNLRLENTWLAVLSSSSRASTGQARPHKRSFSPSGSPPKPCPSSDASSQVSTTEESPPKETQKKKWWYIITCNIPRKRDARRAPLTTPRSHNGHRPSHRRLSARLLRPRRPRDPPALLRKPLGSRRLARGGPEPRHPRPLRPLRLFRRRVLRRQGPPAPLVPRPRRRPPRARSRPLSRSRARGRGRAGWLRGGALREGGAAGPRAHDL